MPRIFTYPLIAEIKEKRFKQYTRSKKHQCYLNLNIGNKQGRWFVSVYYHNPYIDLRFNLPMGVLRYMLRYKDKHTQTEILLYNRMKKKLFMRPGNGLQKFVFPEELELMRPFMLPQSYAAILKYIKTHENLSKTRKEYLKERSDALHYIKKKPKTKKSKK